MSDRNSSLEHHRALAPDPDGAAMDLLELEFRAESCRRVAERLQDPETISELQAMAERFEALAERMRSRGGAG